MTQSSEYDVVVFGAHPDDAEMAMGGTVALLSDAGKRVLVVPLTHSEMSTFGDPETREREAREAARILGVGTEFLDFKDLHVENTPAAREKIVRVLRAARPRIVFAPYHTNPYADFGGISHVDHYTTGALVRDSVKCSRLERFLPEMPKHTVERLFFYMLPRHMPASIIVDVTSVIDRTFEAIQAYSSQLAIQVRGNPIEHALRVSRANLGLTIGAAYAEGFVTDTPMAFSAVRFFEG